MKKKGKSKKDVSWVCKKKDCVQNSLTSHLKRYRQLRGGDSVPNKLRGEWAIKPKAKDEPAARDAVWKCSKRLRGGGVSLVESGRSLRGWGFSFV